MITNGYFVYEEDTLGYIRSDMPGMFHPLASERDRPHDGFHLLRDEVDDLRPATVSDFAYYGVQIPQDSEYPLVSAIPTVDLNSTSIPKKRPRSTKIR